ncbi:MAG: hypothetical protein FIB07_16555 [Candidatus Methanoperedens sp.]|nr:hypothetical protein [Candidatus Methanoperedens sp.]
MGKYFIKILIILVVIILISSNARADFDFGISVAPARLQLAPGGAGMFEISVEDLSSPLTGGTVTLSVSHDDVGHNIAGAGLAPNPLGVPRGGIGRATWNVIASPDAVPGTVIHVDFSGSDPIHHAFAEIEIAQPVGGTMLRINKLDLLAAYLSSSYAALGIVSSLVLLILGRRMKRF